MKIVTSITLLAMLFVLVLVGTLSGAFGVEENLVQNGKIEGNVASAEGVRPFQTIDLSGTFKNTTDTSININPDVAKRGGLYTTNENHLTNNKWETGNATTGGKWYIADNTNHSGSDYVCAWFVFDLGADYDSRVYGDLNISLTGTYTNWNGGGVFAIESGNNLIELPTTTSDGDSTWYNLVKNGNFGAGATYTKTNELKPKNDKKTEFPISLTHTVSGRYVRIHYVTYDPSWNYNEHRLDNVKVTLSRKLAYYVDYEKNSTTATGTVVKSDKLEYFVNNTISNDVYVGNKYYFDHWNTKADNTGVDMAVGAATGTNTNSGFGKVVKDNLQAGITTTTLYAQWNSISFVFNRQTYSVYNGEVLQVLQGHSDYLSSTVSSDYTSTITYKTLSGTSLSSAPTTVGNYIATITVSKGSQTRGAVDLPFAVIEGDFGKLPSGTSGKWGSETNPYVISTTIHLENLSGIVNGTQIALNTIVGSDNGAVTADDVVATDNTYANCYFVVTANITVSSSFARIAKDNAHYFKGNFNGQNYTISGLNCGLFGYVSGGTFKDLTLQGSVSSATSDYYGGLIGYATNITVSGVTNEIVLATSNSYVGGLIGFCQNATIENCHNKANVSGIANVGGIVGFTGDTEKVGFGSHITNSTNSRDIFATGDYVGGIVGWARDTYFTDVVNSGDIKTSGKNVGGISSRVCGGSVTNAQNSGNVEGTDFVGGITGHLSWATITNVSNSGKIIGNDYVGGLVGQGESNDVSNFLVNGTLSNTGCVGGRNYVGGIAGYLKNTTDKNVSIEWDATVNIENCTFGDSSGDGVRGTSYMGGAIGYLGANITISGSISVSGCDIDNENGGNYLVGGAIGYNAGIVSADLTVDARVISRSTGTVNSISGAFTGGVVGYNAGTLSGALKKTSGDVISVSFNDYVGGIVGYNSGVIIGKMTHTSTNAMYENSTVYGATKVGGLVGYTSSALNISNAQNTGKIVGSVSVGGLVGYADAKCTINASANTGSVSGTNNVGGIVGYAKGIDLSGVSNSATINGYTNVGGLVGNIEGGAAITTSNNSGAVNGYKHLGGFVGYAKSSGNALSIEGTSTAPLVNGGKVTSAIPSGGSSANNDGGVAGFVGYLDGDSNITISHCVNNGEIQGLQFNGIAGILGYVKHGANLIYINNCKNTALVEGGINTGGIGGRLSTNSSAVNSMVISHCYNGGEILTQDYSTGSTGNSGTTGGICGYFNATSTTAAARTAVISYCYNVGNVKIVKSTSGQAFAQNDSNKGFIGGIVGNAKSNADNPDTNGKVAIEYCYVDLTSGRSILRYGIDMTTYINGTNLVTVGATSYVIKKGTSITAGNSGSYLLYNDATTTFDYPLVDGTQTTWENIVTQNINGFRLTTNVAEGDYYESLKGVGGALLTPDNFTSVGSSSFVVEAKYTAEQGNIYLDTADIVLVSKTVTYDKQAHTIAAPTLPDDYTFTTLYFTTADAYIDGKGTTSRTDVDDNPYCTETKVLIDNTVVGRMADKNYGTLTITKRELTFTNTWSDALYPNVIDRATQNNFVYNTDYNGLQRNGVRVLNIVNGVKYADIFDITYTTPDQNGEGFLYRTAGTYFRKYTLKSTNYTIKDHADGIVEYKWTIAKNKLTIDNVWTSDNIGGSPYTFVYNGQNQGVKDVFVTAQPDTKGITHTPQASVYTIDQILYSTASFVKNVGVYSGTFTLNDTANYEIGTTAAYIDGVATANATGLDGVTQNGNVITYAWKINQFDVGNAFANKKAWFGAGTDMVVANQNTVKTENVNGTEFEYYYLQAAAGDTPKVIVYQNDKYINNNFVLYVKYTTKTNGVEAHRLVKLVYGTDYEIADLTTAGDKHVADVTVTASGTGNFVGDAVKYYVVADSDFGGNVNQANWGSESNPYVIEHESQLLRLSQIVNGRGKAWNSINGTDGLVANTGAQATNRTYEGCYFVVNANVTLLQSSASGIEGFEPIGNSAYQFKAAQFAKGDGIESVSIEYSFSDTAREYVGLFGYIGGTSIVGIDVVGKGTILGKKYVGGIVGYANGGKIENCSFSLKSLSQDKVSGGDYVGGIVGYANGTTIVQDTNIDTYGEFMQAKVVGASYVGGIAGEWIVTNANQINGDNYILSYAANLISVVGNGSYVGGIAGKLDASGCTTDLTYLGFYTNGKAGTGSDDVMDVYGTSYVGALFGAFIGNGYHYDADNSGVRSVILVKSLDDIRANVIANDDGVGYVMGGLIGYAEKVGILIGCNWTSESMVKNGSTIAKTGVYVDAKGNTSFVGGFVGVLGENATIESVKQEVAVVGGTATISGGQYSVVNKIAIKGKDFVGGLIGYIASSAGSYFGTTGTILGNSIKFYNEAQVEGANYVGGIVGGLGIVENYASYIGSDGNLEKLLSATHNTNAAILGYSTLESDPYTQNPFGKAVNVASVTGSGNYVGGLFGYVGDRVRLTLENAPISTVMNVEQLDTPYGYLNVYNGNKGKTTDGAIIIKGASYVGGITGWLDNQAHDLTFVVNRSYVNGTTYAGGLVGYMRAGTITSSIAVAPEDVTTSTDTYIGTDYIGGFVGYVVGGTIKNSISTGFKFESTGINKSGIMGNGINPTIEGSWTIYVKQNALYNDVSLNSTKGRYLLIDGEVEDVPSIMQLSRMVGLYVADMTYNGNTYTVGKLLVNAKVPSATANKQLAFYDVSGSDNVTDNMSVDGSGNVTATNFTKFGNFSDTDPNALTIEWAFDNANSFSVCTVAIEFVNIPNYKDKEYNQNTAAGKKNAQDAYREPSASKLYVAEVTNAEYWWYPDPQNGANNEGQIKKLTAVIYFKYQNTLVKVGETGNYRIGDYNKEYSNDSIGSKENPIIISTQAQWNEFAYSIYTGQKDYKNQYIRLTTDITISNGTHNDTNGNKLDFGTVASVPSNGSDASTNIGYNFAGNISQGSGDTLANSKMSFKGNFDGTGHRITINYTSGGYHRVSVFPNAGSGSTTSSQTVFKNLTITGNINGGTNTTNAGYDMAGFVGKPFGAIKFENCTNAANIQGLRIIAGIAGCSTASAPIELISCVNKGNITSYEGSKWNRGTGQSIGYPDDYSYGTGGLIAYASANIVIDSCLNTGTIIGQTKVGGIVGRITGSSKTIATIKNCANTGHVEGQELNPYQSDSTKNRAGNAWSRVGGLVGEADQNTELTILASYNTGSVRGLSNVAGGLVGILGTIPDDEKPHSTVAKYSSTIAYSYNTGSVTIGYEQWSGIIMIGSSGYNFNGTNAGGIVGVAVQANINYCYNTGAITAYGGVGYGGSWQSRNGGIVAEVVTNPKTGDNCYVRISNCYNVGKIELQESTNSTARYNADIVGYMEKAQDANSNKIKVLNCYGIANNIVVWKNNKQKYFSGWSDNHGTLDGIIGPDKNCVRTGTTLDSIEDLTAVYNSDGTIRPNSSFGTNNTASTATLTDDRAFNNATASGYIYMPGCLPQLAVFAVDTHNGLSMRSVNYGVDLYGEYVQQSAGNQFSPYVIKDGIDLLGTQSLVDLGYTFVTEYIEFANKNNNITLDTSLSFVESKVINMPTYSSTSTKIADGGDAYKSSTGGSTYNQSGKSYHLFALGAICRDDLNASANAAYTNWLTNNHYYDQANGRMASNATFNLVNFMPIGRKGGSNIFKGSISGKQADGTNTEVANLRIVSTGTDHAFAGLFARAESAEISYITVSGDMRAYARNSDGHSAVGGIVADSSGDTIIDHCNAGSVARELKVFAYGKQSEYKYANVSALHTYAGGIVGVATTSFYQYGEHNYKAGTASIIRNCEVVNATVKSVKNNIGGIVGYVDGQSKANGKNNKIELTGNVVSMANLYALPASSDTDISEIGTRVGGILGYSDQYISVIISGCTVGTDSATKSVTIRGENSIGGIVGALPNAINEIKNCSVKASTLIERGNEWGIVENVNNSISGDSGNHGTAIGGIIGYSYHNTSENAVTTTLSGNIVFNGNINIAQPTNKDKDNNTNNSQDGVVRNVGGVFGDMASGASFATGARIQVNGTITVADDINEVRNIGGVAGRTRDVAFSGNFTVSVTINIPNAYYVGGFIGRNRGEVNILADDTTINIGAKLNGAHDVGGFIGDNDASTGAILYIGENEYRRTRYEKPLSIVISQEATISASGDNVGGIVGGNTSNGGSTVGAIRIVKGSITNNGTVSGANAVGGIIGNNNAGLVTGGGTGPDAVKKLTIVNGGAVSGNNYIGGVIGKLNRGTIAGTFVNNGDVTGQLFVGGSIGYVAFDAVITVAGGVATEFKNGAKEDAYTASGDALTAGDTAAQGVGTVKGKAYVGGSIGIMLGKIVGNANAKVVFTSSGIVDASDVAGYLGGSIGVIAGQVDYAQFISTGELTGINAITAVGGSVGFIGAPTPLLTGTCPEEYAIDLSNVKIIVVNSHFESNGNVKLIGSSAKIAEAKKNDDGSEKGEFEWGGVGGAIGVIAGVSNGFNGGNDWENNTYYAEGNITAPGIYNVGGIVGFIRANGIKINNLLAYDITVDGATNVGGIIGSTIGTGTVIEYAFSISSTDGTGLFTASDANGQAGGIIGKAASDTDASTSYWVKGYKNAELAGTDASRLKDTLGLYTAITEKIQNPDGSYTTVIFTKELVGTTAENGSADTENAIYPTPYDYIDAVGAHVVNGENVTLEKTYTTDETTGEITKRDWTWYFGEYYTNAEFANDTWVLKKPDWKAYSTGTEQTGWYFVYANDIVTDDIVGTVDAAHKSATATNLNDKDFWKRIANAYTNEERKNGDDVRKIYSTIVSSIDADNMVSGGGLLLENNLYATATAANENKSGYYLYIASSGTSRPTAIHGTNDDKFYIQINTAIDKTTIAKNVAVYYRSIAMGSALTYNGYNRYAPISLQKDIKSEPGITDGKVDLTKKNSYAYTTELVDAQAAKTVGTYKSDVYVYYYDDTGKAYKVGGITQGAWKIKQRVLTMSTEGTTSATYGDDNIATTVYIDNIVSEDINKLEFVLSVTGSENVTIKYGVHDWSNNGVSIALVSSDASKSLSGSDANFNVDTIDKNTYKLKFTVNFTNAKKYSLSVALADNALAKNYSLNNAEKDVEVKRKELTIKGPVGGSSDNGKAEVTYNGNEHGATWTVDGIVKKTGYNDTISSVFKHFNPQFVVRIRKDPNKDEYLSPASFDLVQKGTATVNNRTIEFGYSDNANTILFSGAIDAGNYYLAFTNCEDNASNETNYYIKYEQTEDYTPNRPKSKSFTISTNMLTVTWSSTSTSHVYEPGKKGVLTAKVVAKEPINDFKTFVEKYFETSWTNLKGTDISISAQSDNKTATITFTTNDNAGTYTANVKVKERTDQDVVNCGCNNATPTKSYKIDKKTITISFLDDGKKTVGSTEYEYNTGVQGLKTISISGLYSNQSVEYSLNVTSYDAKVQYNGKTYSRLSNSGSADLSGRDWIDAGTYTATLTLGTDAVSNNYQLTSNNTSRVATAQWTITQKEIKINSVSMSNVTYDAQPHKPTFSLSIGTSSTGTYTWHNDTISINYKNGSADAQAFVNAGKYNVSVAQNAISAKRGSLDTTANYIVDSSSTSTISFEIYPRQITLTWDTTITSFVYTGNYSGLKVSDAENGGTHYKVSGATLDSVKISACGNDVITVSLTGKQTEVNQVANGYKMSYKSHTVTGTNSGEQSVASNYTFGSQSSPDYFITPSILTIKSVGGSTTKVYDANKKVTDTSRLTFVVGSSNGGANGENGFFTFEGEYDDKHVGEGKKVTLKFTFTKPTSGNYIVNESELVDNVIVRELAVGSITPKELEVKLDKLRSGKATRVYNGATWYGGEKGAMYSSGTSARSVVYRSGEGFIVDGFPSAEQSGTVTISAVYKEADAKRGEFDSYVNFVYVDENKVYHKGTVTNKLFKTLVFSISGECAQNYTFKVTNGTDAYSGTVGNATQSVTVYDSRDEQNKDKRPANAGNINIEITVKSFKVEYTNTSQSYANSDNTYNTDWKTVEATKTPDGTTVTVLNGWMYENGESGTMKTYNKYTVIRGRMGSKQLSAQVSGEKGMEHNYNMSNQPILTIGYFVDKTDFEVGSIASLMIASYYWYASQHADSPDFTPIVSAGSEWVSIVTNDVYGTGAFGESNKPADAPENCNSWDEYFAYIEQKENVTVFLNEYENNSWGYYKTTQTTTKPAYISYRQTADFTGIVKQADIEILNNFFTTYTFGEDGTATPTQHTWGNGGEYITNFLKPSVGNVLTAFGSVFVSTDAGFGGTYNGNGYVIEYLNIYGFGGATQNVGMFDKIGNGSVSGLHLRNVTISANGGNVGGIAGEILAGEASSDVANVSFHGSITVSGSGNVGGLFGKSARNIDKAIVLGSITANGGNVAGVVGSLSGTLSSVVSLMQVDASGTVAPIANGGTVTDSTYLANAVWSKDGNGKIAYAGGNGTAKSYAELMGGSISGYGKDNKYYYAGETPNTKGEYDVIDEVLLSKLDVDNNSNPRQSMRLRDVVDVYLLMYSLSETTATESGDINGARTYTISTTSWLVGDKHGTSKADAIVIANKQNVALLRQLRFATFVLMVDFTSYEAQSFGGAFYGTIYQNGHSIPTDWLNASFADVTKATIVNE